MNAFLRNRLEFGHERNAGTPEPQQQASDLYQPALGSIVTCDREWRGFRSRDWDGGALPSILNPAAHHAGSVLHKSPAVLR